MLDKVQNSDVILARMMRLHPKVMDLSLDRVWRLLEALGNPQTQLPPVIHIAGTNGKGSTQAMLRAGFEGAGQRVHAYTSPHLVRFHERIRLAGALIDEAALSELLDECDIANQSQQITYFEITTCAALLAMSRIAADFCLLEVGLGGRVDATNVIEKPKACVITPVSMDHEQFLGDTIGKIAFEKAGILKPGVPCIVGQQDPQAREVIEECAAEIGAPLWIYGQDFQTYTERDRLIFQDNHGLLDLPLPRLPGDHQVENAAMVLALLRYLKQPQAAMKAAMQDATWPARLQRLTHGNLPKMAPEAEIWLDGGHNPAAGQALASFFAKAPKRPTIAICGMLNTKEIDGFLSPVARHFDALIGMNIPGEANALPAEKIAQYADALSIKASTAESLQDAIQDVITRQPNARIVFCGSLYFAGHVLRENEAC